MGQPFSAAFELLDLSGAPIDRGSTSVVLDVAQDERRPLLELAGSPPLRIDLADLDAIRGDDDRTVRLRLVGRELVLSRLESRRDELLGQLLAAWRDLAAQRLVLDEGTAGERFPVAFERGALRGEGQLRLYPTRLAILPDDASLPLVLGLGQLRDARLDPQRFGVDLLLADGGVVKLGRLGRQTEPLQRLVEERLTALRQRTAAALGALFPGLSSAALRRFLAHLPDGIPASAACLESAAPDAFPRLLRVAGGTEPLAARFRHLAALAGEDAVILVQETPPRPGPSIALAAANEDLDASAAEGVEGGSDEEDAALAALHGRTALCAFPIPERNAVVIETGPGSRSATYVFRLAAPPELARLDPDDARALGRARSIDLVRLLASLGPERGLLFLDETRLLADGWKLALRRLPGLGDARARLVGRIALGPSWRVQLDEALARTAG